MDRKKTLRMEFREQKTIAGVFQIKNMKNHKTFVESTPNIRRLNGHKFMLEHQAHPNNVLQSEWNEFGGEAFVIELLETLDKKPDDPYDVKDALKKLKNRWVQELQPFGDRGYNPMKTTIATDNLPVQGQ